MPPDRLPHALLALRLGVFVVMFMWTLDKFINPGHAGKVFAGFYGISDATPVFLTAVAALQLVIIALFVAGALRRISYGLVLLMHGVSTFASWRQYLEPFDHLLFFAAWPMLAACLALYWLRDHDTLLAFDARKTG